MNTGLKFLYDYPQELGSDRICNAVASRGLYGGCCITVDFGTATTFGVLTEDTFLGGMICPGFKISTNALIESTAMLPKVEYIKPERVIGHKYGTLHSIRHSLRLCGAARISCEKGEGRAFTTLPRYRHRRNGRAYSLGDGLYRHPEPDAYFKWACHAL